MSGSFGTLAILGTLPQVCTKLGLTRDGRVSDLGSDQGAKQKASELRPGEGRPGLFTELFTVRYAVVTMGSAPGDGRFKSRPSSNGPEVGGGGRGGALERCEFSPHF